MNNKLYISLSFDDGRVDNYTNVLKVLKKYNLKATIHVITGYIDGTYNNVLASSPGPCNIEQLSEMKKNGFEISLHGDMHTTDSDDYNNCISKLKQWNLLDKNYGFSIPHSEESKLTEDFFINLSNTNTKYIRTGKNTKKINIIYKILYLFSSIFSSPYLFNLYNEINVNKFKNIDYMRLNSITIKKKTSFNMLKKIIDKRINNNEWIIFMFHSVLNENDELLSKSDWAWSLNEFEKLCKYLSELKKLNKINVDSIIDIVCEGNNEI